MINTVVTLGMMLAGVQAGVAGGGAPTAIRATTECRAGCQGNVRGCQESLQSAVFTASPGRWLMVDSRTLVKRWNASDSPGLAAEPRWIVETYPANSNRALSVTIRPDKLSCVGVSPHTQGVTFFEFQLIQQP